ncbi:DUF6055 domain-containing protein [Vibrio mangrovi]|uniref:DUF6055 domain-containing protein n=1 Tax=Vibrio mangrovi TaxID=474394 RepID=A0A1Y6IMS9_9VIBR|nr:DUF6055 domain-containing protein [Vibrio mangrovi]MDW6004244.1 DUF6055 domain-containing protein [Vibrio mangrovi]SMR98957.1 hypothetical protein VIM7927_00177 [Vibrio mangrovi]
MKYKKYNIVNIVSMLGLTLMLLASASNVNAAQSCVAGNWVAPAATGTDGSPLRIESAHFATYWADGTNINQSQAWNALNTLESIWDIYFGDTVNFQEPYCNSSAKYKAGIHFGNNYGLSGGGWYSNGHSNMGMWVGPGTAADGWGLAHEFAHGVQSLTPAFPECGGVACWIYESHANWMAHQVFPTNLHCSEMLANAPHLHYGNTRDRYCNWQFFEYLKDKFGHEVVNNMWTKDAPYGWRDPWTKLMYNQNWNIEQLNDLFGEWAMHNVTWDYRNPDGSNKGSLFRSTYGAIDQDPGNNTHRRLRLTQLESMDNQWQGNHRFVSPYHWAPQRWGYNVIRLYPEANTRNVTITFRGVAQSGANSGWRWGLVATDSSLSRPRYSELKSGTDGQLSFAVNSNEELYLVVLAAPTQYQKITWEGTSDGTPYPSIYRYPYMVQMQGAWPAGFRNGNRDACPNGTVRHPYGGGCAVNGTPSSVYVGPYAKVLGGNVSGNARIVDHATVVNGTVSGNSTVGAMSLIGVAPNNYMWGRQFHVRDNAVVESTFYPMGWFSDNQSASGNVRLLGDLEYYTSKSYNTFYGLVNDNWNGVNSVNEVTVMPPYQWRN